MKILKNKLFIPIISCFLALVTIFSFYSLPKAKASQIKIDDVFYSEDFSTYISFNVYDSYPDTIISFVDLVPGVDLLGSNIYFSCNSKYFARLYFDDFYLDINKILDDDVSLDFVYLDSSGLYSYCRDSSIEHCGCFSFKETAFPDNTSFIVRDIKYFDDNGIECTSIDFDILISPSSVHNFLEWVDEVPATETTKGIKGHYTCSHCNKYFNENYVEISNLEIPIKTDKPNNGGFSGSGVSSGASCSSASIYGIFGIAIVFSFVAFAISHITKRKKPKRK